MWHLRGRGLVPLLVAAILLTFTVRPAVAAQSSAVATAAARSAAAARYDGEAIFRGLVFGQGPVAKLFPELANTPVATPQQAAAIDMIVGEMRTLDQGFFDRFGREMQSGSRVRIRAAIDEANTLGERAVTVLNGKRDPGLAQGDGAALFVFVVAAVVLVVVGAGAVVVVLVAAGAAAVVAVIVYLAFWFWHAQTAEGQRQSALLRDQWSNKVATTLRAMPIAD